MSAPERHNSLDAVGVGAMVGTLVFWSVTPLLIKYFAGSIDAWTSNGWRYGFAAVLWAPLLIIALCRRKFPAGLALAALVPALVNSGAQVCFTWAHYKIDPGLLTFGLRSQLLFVAAGAYMLFPQERALIRSRGYGIGMLLVFIGTIGTVLLGGETVSIDHLAGVGLAIGAGFGFAMYGLAVRVYVRQYDSKFAFAMISQYTALAMVAMMIPLGERSGMTVLDPDILNGRQLALLALSSIIGIALGHITYYVGMARCGVALTTGVIQLQPFGVAIGSYFAFREVLTLGQWASGAMAVAGAICMLAVQRRLTKAARASAAATDRA